MNCEQILETSEGPSVDEVILMASKDAEKAIFTDNLKAVAEAVKHITWFEVHKAPSGTPLKVVADTVSKIVAEVVEGVMSKIVEDATPTTVEHITSAELNDLSEEFKGMLKELKDLSEKLKDMLKELNDMSTIVDAKSEVVSDDDLGGDTIDKLTNIENVTPEDATLNVSDDDSGVDELTNIENVALVDVTLNVSDDDSGVDTDDESPNTSATNLIHL